MKKKSNRIWWILGGITLAVVAALVIAKQTGAIGKEEGTEVETAKAKTADIIERVSASGKVQPEVEVKLAPEVSGEIVSLSVKEGDSVRANQVLIKIRPDNYESFLARAEAAVNTSKAQLEQSKANASQVDARLIKAKLDFDRNKKLFDDKVISQADWDNFEANYRIAKQDAEAAKANIEAAKFGVSSSEANLKDAAANLRKTIIFAPQSGTISKLNVELGERVVGTSQMAGTEMLRIADLNNMEIRVNVNENDIIRVAMGDTVIVDVDAYSGTGRKFKGVVYEIASSANGTGTASTSISTDGVTEFEVKIRVLRGSYRDLIKGRRSYPLKPGMTASVDIVTDRKSSVLTVPIGAVTTRDPYKKVEAKKEEDGNNEPEKDSKKDKKELKEYIFVIDKEGRARAREIKTGISDFENIEIVSGISTGEEVIAGPFNLVDKTLKDGDLIKRKSADKKEKEKKN